jgi:hypothetical protein
MFRPGATIRGQNTVHPLAIAAPITVRPMAAAIASASTGHAPIGQVAP